MPLRSTVLMSFLPTTARLREAAFSMPQGKNPKRFVSGQRAQQRVFRRMVSAILFDCDGVLVDSEILAVEVETAMLAQAGLIYDEAEFRARFMGMSDAAFFAALEADSLAQLGRSLPGNFRQECHDRLGREVRARLTEVTGAREAIADLTKAKAVASSSRTEHLRVKLGMTGMWEHFAPHIYSADHVVHAKPAPDLFLFAASQLRVSPASCLVIEDSVNGVKGALAAGMRVWGFAGGGHMDAASAARLSAAGAERIVGDWREASRLFAAL
jgi:HAD superfamily hydrolase (TIGR01509 family)